MNSFDLKETKSSPTNRTFPWILQPHTTPNFNFQVEVGKREAKLPAGDPEAVGAEGGGGQAEEGHQEGDGRHGEAGLHGQDEERARHAHRRVQGGAGQGTGRAFRSQS